MLPKLDVAGSSPVARSFRSRRKFRSYDEGTRRRVPFSCGDLTNRRTFGALFLSKTPKGTFFSLGQRAKADASGPSLGTVLVRVVSVVIRRDAPM